MLRPGTLAAGFAAAMLASSMAYAANFQEGQFKNCAGSPTCTLHFNGPAPGKTLRVQHVSCRLRTTAPAPQWIVQVFDGVHGVFVPTDVQDNGARRAFVANSPVTYFTAGGRDIIVEALLNAPIPAEFACTITGQSS
jgi:hypothetical protein